MLAGVMLSLTFKEADRPPLPVPFPSCKLGCIYEDGVPKVALWTRVMSQGRQNSEMEGTSDPLPAPTFLWDGGLTSDLALTSLWSLR